MPRKTINHYNQICSSYSFQDKYLNPEIKENKTDVSTFAISFLNIYKNKNKLLSNRIPSG